MAAQITALPTPPTRQDPSNFNDRADTFLAALPTFQTEANTLSVELNGRADSVKAVDMAVIAATNITKWSSGVSYSEGSVVWSPINGLGYRRLSTGSSTTDPSLDATKYKQVNGTGDVSTSGNQSISGVKVFYDNIGIGVTPTNLYPLGKTIDITSGNKIFGSVTHASFLQNVALDENGSFLYQKNGFASRYTQISGAHKWDTAPNGNAGNQIIFTPAMTLDANGNLFVGVSSGASHIFKKETGDVFQSLLTVSDSTAPVFRIMGGVNTGLFVSSESVVYVGKANSTSRSINTTGTINASGADYAEYEHNNGLTISKGSIIGFKSDGSLTLTYSDAIRFGIKSTDPSYVGGDTWGNEDNVGNRPEQPADDANQSVKDQYAAELTAFEARLEVARKLVDRIAYSGKVPVNVIGATPGGYIIAAADDSDAIVGEFVHDPDFSQYKRAVGRVNKLLPDGRCEVAVIVH